MRTSQVEIYGQRYVIRGDADEEYIRRVAAHVDEQMRSLASGMKTATPVKLAVLTAINIAHQLFQAEQIRQQEGAAVERRALSLLESIDEQLEPAHRR
ncbi:MAG: cell division protein ZapA [Nitrospirota bacterium]